MISDRSSPHHDTCPSISSSPLACWMARRAWSTMSGWTAECPTYPPVSALMMLRVSTPDRLPHCSRPASALGMDNPHWRCAIPLRVATAPEDGERGLPDMGLGEDVERERRPGCRELEAVQPVDHEP